MPIKTGWVHQREFAPSRVAWIIDGMSRRTQEAVAAARANRPFRYSSDIVAEDLVYAIHGRKAEEFRRVATSRYIDFTFGQIVNGRASLEIRVQNGNDTWYRETIVIDEDEMRWSHEAWADAQAIIAAKHSAPSTQNSTEVQS